MTTTPELERRYAELQAMKDHARAQMHYLHFNSGERGRLESVIEDMERHLRELYPAIMQEGGASPPPEPDT